MSTEEPVKGGLEKELDTTPIEEAVEVSQKEKPSIIKGIGQELKYAAKAAFSLYGLFGNKYGHGKVYRARQIHSFLKFLWEPEGYREESLWLTGYATSGRIARKERPWPVGVPRISIHLEKKDPTGIQAKLEKKPGDWPYLMTDVVLPQEYDNLAYLFNKMHTSLKTTATSVKDLLAKEKLTEDDRGWARSLWGEITDIVSEYDLNLPAHQEIEFDPEDPSPSKLKKALTNAKHTLNTKRIKFLFDYFELLCKVGSEGVPPLELKATTFSIGFYRRGLRMELGNVGLGQYELELKKYDDDKARELLNSLQK